MDKLFTSNELGVKLIKDSLKSDEKDQTGLSFKTKLQNLGSYGRTNNGFCVVGGLNGGYVEAIADRIVKSGNRSHFGKISFKSTQTGVKNNEHGKYSLHFVVSGWLEPLSICVDNGRFYITDLKNELLAGNREEIAFEQLQNVQYCLSGVIFEKGIYARLSGENIKNNEMFLEFPDKKRFIPGHMGFGIESNINATGGEAILSDWEVSTIGPFEPILGAIGDSITAGLVDDNEENSYVHQATRAIGQQLTLNAGSGGAQTIHDLERFFMEIAPFKPKIVWIEGGTNDIINRVPAEKSIENIKKEIELITWDAVPLLSTIPPLNGNDDEQNKQLSLFNDYIRNSGIAYVDRCKLVRSKENTFKIDPLYDYGDGVHLNHSGVDLIAQEAIIIIKNIAKQKSLLKENIVLLNKNEIIKDLLGK